MKEFLELIVSWGPLGVFILSALDSAGIPLPSMVDALIVAVLVQEPSRAPITLIGAILGSIVGNTVLFTIARKGGQSYLNRLTSGARGKKFRKWFDEYGLVSVFIPAVSVVPMPLKAFVACSAVLGTPLLRFLGVIAIARLIRYGFVTWLAVTFDFHDFRDVLAFIMLHKWWFLGGSVALGLVFYMISRFVLRRPQEEPMEQI